MSVVLEAVKSGQSAILILSDGTGVFVLLVYWVNQADLQCKVQMERWDGSVLDNCAACADLGQKCLQIPGPEVIKLEFILKLKIKRNDWLIADMCPQAANHCTLF